MASCAQCLYENAEGASTCEQCGEELVEVLSLQLGEVCRRCDSYNDPGVRICISCGHRMGSRAHAAPDTAESADSADSRSTTAAPSSPADATSGTFGSSDAGPAESTRAGGGEPVPTSSTPSTPAAAAGSSDPESGATDAPFTDVPTTSSPAAFGSGAQVPMAPPSTPPPGWLGAPRAPGQASIAVGSIRCDRCGGENQPTARFCGSCGQALVTAGTVPRSRAKLIVIRGNGEGRQVPLSDTPVSAGRGDVTLSFPDDPYLSLLHATFRLRDEQVLVSDEGATNGVYVRIRQAQSLRPGDMFVVGERVLRFVGLESASPVNPARFGAPRTADRLLVLEEVLAGGAVGRVCRRPGPVLTLGRGGCDLNFPNDGFVSARHAELTLAGETIFLRDLGSANGTYLRIAPHGERTLVHGDYVALGRELVRVELAS